RANLSGSDGWVYACGSDKSRRASPIFFRRSILLCPLRREYYSAGVQRCEGGVEKCFRAHDRYAVISPKDPVSQLLEQIGVAPQEPIEPIATRNSTQL